MPGLGDHVVAASLLVLWPLWIARYGRAEIRDLASNPSKRLRHYLVTISGQWAAVGLILAVWCWEGRSWSGLGLRLSFHVGFTVAIVMTIAFTWVLWSQWHRVQRDPDFAAVIREQMTELESFVPRTRREVRVSQAMAFTAGICEELAYRGFLLWYLTAYMHISLAIVVMALAFGAVHLYQSVRAAVQIAGVGAAAALFYLLSGSLWLPMLLHILLDLNQLSMARHAFGADGRAVAVTT